MSSLVDAIAGLSEIDSKYCVESPELFRVGQVFFDTNQSTPKKGARRKLTRFVDDLKKHGGRPVRLIVEGFADSVGSERRNSRLARKRAERAVRDLQKQLPGMPVEIISRGEPFPPAGSARAEPYLRRADLSLAADFTVRPSTELVANIAGQAVSFDPEDPDQGPLFRAVDNRMTFGPKGMVEFWIEAKPNASKSDDDPTVLLGKDGGKTNLVIATSRDRKRIIVQSGAKIRRFEADLDRPGLHHVAIVHVDRRVEVWVDGMLRGATDFDLGGLTVDRIAIGGAGAESGRFHGRLGGFRFWNDVVDCQGIRTLLRTPGEWPDASPLNDALAALTEPRGDTLDLVLLEGIYRPADEIFVHYGSDHVEFADRNFLNPLTQRPPARRQSNEYAEVTDDGAGIHSPMRSSALHALSFPDKQGTEAFTAYPLFTVRHDPASGDDEPPVAMAGRTAVAPFRLSVPDGHRLRRIQTAESDRVRSVQIVTAAGGSGEDALSDWFGGPGGRQNAYPCDAAAGGQDAPIGPHERVVGISGAADAGAVYTLRVHTSERILTGCPGRGRSRAPKDASPFHLWVEHGAPFGGLAVTAEMTLEGLGVLSAMDATLPAIIVTREDGVAERFERSGRNAYRSVTLGPLVVDDRAPVQRVLRLEHPHLFRIDGVEVDFVSAAATERPDPVGDKKAFDDTFVRLSKAVNLQANYRSYDIVRMDPLHLVENGTDKSVFAMPSPDSADYQDFNRVFVPDGLKYIAEFTGGSTTSSTYSSTSTDYKKHFSKTVGFSLGASGGAKAGQEPKNKASFSHSKTIDRARSIHHGKQKDTTLSTSQFAFYALTLDKARMRLDPEFVDRVERLKTHGTDADYRRFVEVFGTHYPYGVIYGGMGVLQLEYDRTDFAAGLESSTSVTNNAQLAIKGISAGANSESKTAIARNFASKMGTQFDSFYFVGGAHAGATRESWGVGLDGVVPTYVDLKPLEDLLQPPFFDDPVIVHDVRHRLAAAISSYLDGVALAERLREERFKNQRPHVFEITLASAAVTNVGDEADKTFELAGWIGTEAKTTSGGAPVDPDPVGSVNRFFDRPGRLDGEVAGEEARPTIDFDWDGRRVKGFNDGFVIGITLGIAKLIEELDETEVRTIDKVFASAESIDKEALTQVFVVPEDRLGSWYVEITSALKESDQTEPFIGKDDVLSLDPPSTGIFASNIFRESDFPATGSATKSIYFEDDLCGLDCTGLKLNFTLRRLQARGGG